MPVISFKVNPEHAKMTEIVPGLFICGVSSLNPLVMGRYGITYIINATNEKIRSPKSTFAIVDLLDIPDLLIQNFQVPNLKSFSNIQRTKLWLDDTPQTYIYPHLELQSDQIRAIIADGGKVLVHCVAGVSRSASICLAYLTKYRCRTLRDAYHLMASKRPLVRPNIGFWRQLIAFEQDVKGTFGSVKLIRDEAQESALLPDVYLKEAIVEQKEKSDDQKKKRKDARLKSSSPLSTPKFRPVLEPLPELVEAIAS